MSNERDIERAKQAAKQMETEAASRSNAAAVQAQAESVLTRQHNPQFYDKFVRSSVQDSDEYGDLAESMDTWLADDHVLSNRRQIWRQQAQLLNPARAIEEVVGRDPGVRLREKPLLYALANGEHPELDEAIPLSAGGQSAANIGKKQPIDSAEKTAVGDIADVATARMAMGVDSAGSDALTKAQTENVTRQEGTTEESGGLRSSISGVFD